MKTSEKRRKKSWKRILKHKTFRKRNILSLFCILMSIILIIFITTLNLLPWKYILGISILLLLMDFIGIWFMNLHKKIVLKILGVTIILLSIFGSCIGFYYISTTNNFINDSFKVKNSYVKTTYYVVGKTSKGLTKNDIAGEVGVYKESINLSKAIEKLNEKYSIKEKEYDDFGIMFENLANETDQFLLIEKSSYEIVFSISDTFEKSDYTILYQFEVYSKRSKKTEASTEKFNVYIGGTDFAGLSDFNMIATINTKTHKILLTSVPRDYYIEVAGKEGRYDKLSFMNAYGSDVNRESLEKLFATTIDYSIFINTDSLVTIVDYVGGIEFCSDYEFTTTHALVTDTYNDKGQKLHVVKGCQHLNGVETLTVARERNAFPGRDRVRQQNCQKIMIAIFKKLVSTDTILHYNEALNTLSSLYETDLSKDIVTNAAKDILNNGNKWKIETQSVDGTDEKNKVHLSNMTDWVMIPDLTTVNKAKENIEKTLQ